MIPVANVGFDGWGGYVVMSWCQEHRTGKTGEGAVE